MAGAKRRKIQGKTPSKKGGTASSLSPAKTASQESPDKDKSLNAIVDRLLGWVELEREFDSSSNLKSKKTPIQEMLHAFIASKVLLSSKDIVSSQSTNEYNLDAYYWILATNLLNRIQKNLSKDDIYPTDRQANLLLLTFLCDSFSQIFAMIDSTRAQKAGTHVVRAAHSATVACIQGLALLNQNHQHTDQKSSDKNLLCFRRLVRALDLLVNMSLPPPAAFEEPEVILPLPLIPWNELRAELEDACRSLVSDNSDIENCLSKICSMESITAVQAETSPSSKRTARSRRSTKATDMPSPESKVSTKILTSVLDSLSKTTFSNLEELSQGTVRFGLTRDLHSLVVWHNQGQIELLKCVSMLKKNNELFLSMTCWERSYWARRLICIVVEVAGKASSPTGQIDQFLSSLNTKSLPPERQARKSGKASKYRSRPDLRNHAVVAIHDMLHLHSICLVEVSESFIVNDDSDVVVHTTASNDTSKSFKKVSVALELGGELAGLCRVAGANSEVKLFSDSTRVLRTLTSAKILQMTVNHELPLDCRLVDFAVVEIANLVKPMDETPVSSLSFDEADRNFSLSEPLNNPWIEEGGTQKTGFAAIDFATMFTINEYKSLDDGLFALIIRSLHTPDLAEKVAETGIISTFFSSMIDILRRCYDVRVSDDILEDTKAKSKTKRRAKSSSRKTKRRKVLGKDNSIVSKAETTIEGTPIVCLSDLRASIAKHVLRTIGCCLSTGAITRNAILTTMRPFMKPLIVLDFLAAGDHLDRIVLKSRAGPSRILQLMNHENQGDPDHSSALSHPRIHENEFKPVEEEVWNEHIRTTLVLVRGDVEYDPKQKHLLSDSELYELAASFATTKGLWPLSLPIPQQAFFVASLTCRLPASTSTPIDSFLTQRYTDSIIYQLFNMNTISSPSKEKNALYLEDDILLSLRDARIFMMAYGRTTVEDQRKILDRMIDAIRDSLVMLSDRDGVRATFISHPTASGFLARVLVTLMTMVNFASYSHKLRQELFTQCLKTQYDIPAFLSWNDWYSADRSYMGLFDDWESPLLPGVETSRSILNRFSPPLKERTIKELRNLLEKVFSFGFETAKADKSHLLFAAWNCLGKLIGESPASKLRASESISLQISGEDYSKRILQMRDDLCLVQSEINSWSKGSRTMSPLKYRSNLKSMLHRSNILTNHLLKKLSSESTHDKKSERSFFSLLCSLPVYVAGCVAAHTKPGDDYFTQTLMIKQPHRSLPGGHEDLLTSALEFDGFDSEAFEEAASRLRDCSDALNGAPCHPDWLDNSCTFHEGIKASDAVDNAETAMSILNNLVSAALIEYRSCMAQIIKRYHREQNLTDWHCKLALDLVTLGSDDSLRAGLDEATQSDWYESISKLFGLPDYVLDLVTDNAMIDNFDAAKESWGPNSAQRLFGRLQGRHHPLSGWDITPAALRAGGEWELLLSENLALACIASRPLEDELSLEYTSDNEDSQFPGLMGIYDEIEKIHLWRAVIISATGSLLPTSSLLRMGLCGGGRKRHPFNSKENCHDPYRNVPLDISERIISESKLPATAQQTAHKTMSLLLRLACEGDESLLAISNSVASQLYADSIDFENARLLMELAKLISCLEGTLRSITEHGEQQEAIFVLIRGICILLKAHSSERETEKIEQNNVNRLLSLLDCIDSSPVSTVCGDQETSLSIFQQSVKIDLSLYFGEPEWNKMNIQSALLFGLISVLFHLRHEESSACAAFLLNGLANFGLEDFSKDNPIWNDQNGIIAIANKLQSRNFIDAILGDICDFGPQDMTRKGYRENLSCFCQTLVQTVGSNRLNYATEIFECLMVAPIKLSMSSDRKVLNPFTNLLASYGLFLNRWQEIVKKAVDYFSNATKKTLGLQLIFDLLRLSSLLDSGVSKRNPPTTRITFKKKIRARDSFVPNWCNLDPPFPTSCSFVQKSGYHGQHWYNCYTCGLIWEKGCCTICAVVCHKGHDVSYSRYSSFFCDCGAEDGTPEGMVACRCLAPLPESKTSSLFSATSDDNESEDGYVTANGQSCEISKDSFHPIVSCLPVSMWRNRIADLRTQLNFEYWRKSLFGVFREAFRAWQLRQDGFPDLKSLHQLRLGGHLVSSANLARLLRLRSGLQLEVKRMERPTMMPIRAIRGRQTESSSESSNAAQLLARLGEVKHPKSIIDADSRGRFVVAESCELLFCNSLPACATRYADLSTSFSLSRQQSSVLHSCSLKNNILGLKICTTNNRYVLAWGATQARALLMKPKWNAVEVDLELSTGIPNESNVDQIIKCEWLPGSSRYIVIVSQYTIKFYDITKADESCLLSGVFDTVGSVDTIRDVEIIPFHGKNSDGKALRAEFRFFLLSDMGHLNSLDFMIDSDGQISSKSKASSLDIPMLGVRPDERSKALKEGISVPTIEEGVSITYLKHSRVLLYSSASTCVVALIIGSNGKIEGSFEFLPCSINFGDVDSSKDTLAGPLHHWTELGICYREGEARFHACCIGKTKETGQSKLLRVEFNNAGIHIGEILWPKNGTDTMDSCPVIDGLCSFSLPFLATRAEKNRTYAERTFLCASTSAGDLLFWGESSFMAVDSQCLSSNEHRPVCAIDLSESPRTLPKAPDFPITVFEKLKNIGDCNDVFFFGEGTECDPADLKSRLSRDSSSSFVCRSREGCCISIAIQGNIRSEATSFAQNLAAPIEREIAIVAVRILVGSSMRGIPNRVFVQGRPIDFTPKVKKWYSVPLTEEEIVLGIRNGMISVSMFSEAGSIVIDAMEVYAIERKHFDEWLPRSYLSDIERDSDLFNSVMSSSIRTFDSVDLVDCATALNSLFDLRGEKTPNLSEDDQRVVESFVQATLLSDDASLRVAAERLIAYIQPDEALRGLVHGECLLAGGVEIVQRSIEFLKRCKGSYQNEIVAWGYIYNTLRRCIDTFCKVARQYPTIYIESNEKTNGTGFAPMVSALVLRTLENSIPCYDLIANKNGVIDLILLGIAIGVRDKQYKQLRDFSMIRQFLLSEDTKIVSLTCEAILSFCVRERPSRQGGDLFTQIHRTSMEAYRCDSCNKCPLRKVRYTVAVEDDFEIDLCKSCYDLGRSYASTRPMSSQVLINGRRIGAGNALTCGQVMVMQPVSLDGCEQISMRSEQKEAASEQDMLAQHILPVAWKSYDDFLSCMFEHVLIELGEMKSFITLRKILSLLLFFVKAFHSEVESEVRAKSLSSAVSSRLYETLLQKTSTPPEGVDLQIPSTLIQALHFLLAGKFPEESSGHDNRDIQANKKSITAVVCDVHKIPAVRRRSPRGAFKDRRFYVCGMERGKRCKFFRWADELEKEDDDDVVPPPVSVAFKSIVQKTFWSPTREGLLSLQLCVCQLLEKMILRSNDDVENLHSSDITNKDDAGTKHAKSKCFQEYHNTNDIADGVLCSREKLYGIDKEKSLQTRITFQHWSSSDSNGDDETNAVQFVKACFDFLSLIADYQTDGIYRWFSLLCEVESSAKQNEIRLAAKTCIKSLCGKKRPLCQSVRNHFSYVVQFRKLCGCAGLILQECLLIGRRARVCDSNWASGQTHQENDFNLWDVIGADDLISEDFLPTTLTSKIEDQIESLLGVAKTGGESWKSFCCLRSLPSGFDMSEAATPVGFLASPPLTVLFLICFSLRETCQLKLLRLINLGLTKSAESKTVRESAMDDIQKVLQSQEEKLSLAHSPEEILLEGKNKLTVKDTAKFIMHFVLNGRSVEIRRIALQIISSLVSRLKVSEREKLFELLLSTKFMELGIFGRGASEFLTVLQHLAKTSTVKSDVGYFASLVMDCFIEQMSTIKNGRANGKMHVLEGVGRHSTKQKIELEPCRFCLLNSDLSFEQKTSSPRRENRVSLRRRLKNDKSSDDHQSLASPQKRIHPQQTSSFSRQRLDSIKSSSASDEFSTFVCLKQRMVLTNAYVSVTDPRGRFVKTITVFFLPRPSDEALQLKSATQDSVWQECGKISIVRGASNGSCKLPQPVVAANLKIEYTAFYERAGGAKSSDGSVLVHCPRCTRVVTNSHGVCGNCGEVAFQCRKCRHINYDRLDAFLCVECGYCASGTFSFEFNAAGASNAVAITNDEDHDRSMKTIGSLVSIESDLKSTLSTKVRALCETSTTEDNQEFLDETLRKALSGLPPVIDSSRIKSDYNIGRLDEDGTIVRLAARPERSYDGKRSSGPSERTRSLLRLARHIRNESSSVRGDRRSGNLIIRHLGRDGSHEDHGETIGILESEGNGEISEATAGLNTQRTFPANAPKNKQEASMEINRLYSLFREANLELYEVQRRADAWQVLNEGSLVDLGVEISDDDEFQCSQCSHCGTTLALNLLMLWCQLFIANPFEVDVDEEFIALLLTESSSVSKTFSDYIQKVVKDIALNSNEGAHLVLKDLRQRLLASDDTIAGEVLGEIMLQEKFFMSDDYAKLAMEIMSRR